MQAEPIQFPLVPTKPEIVSYDPATGAEIGRVPIASRAEIEIALKTARTAAVQWAATSFGDRGRIVVKARQVILDQIDEIAALISRESGKPIIEAISMEIAPSLDLMQFFARKAKRLLRPEKIDIGLYKLLGRSSRVEYRPLGVIGIISPWNFPWAIPAGEVVMALMAGNAVILKPSELTPLVGLKIFEIFNAAGLPHGVLQVLTGDGSTGAALTEAGFDKIIFTGSVATGRKVAVTAAKNLTPVVLELGGKDPMIVLDDADLESASSAAIWGAFSNSGQACASVERCYVDKKIEAKFLELILKKTLSLRQRSSSDAEADIAAMSSEPQLAIVDNQVTDAISRGAKVLSGGKRATEFKGSFYPPTIMTGVDHSMPLMKDETFGPVLPVMSFSTDDEAIKLANDSPFGLTASIWSGNISRAERLARRIEAGTVTINEVLYTHAIAQTPWGGIKQSGLGRTHGKAGLMELVSARHIHVNRITMIPDVWWFGYSPLASTLFRGMARRFASGSLLQALLLSPQIVRRLFEKRRRD